MWQIWNTQIEKLVLNYFSEKLVSVIPLNLEEIGLFIHVVKVSMYP